MLNIILGPIWIKKILSVPINYIYSIDNSA